MTEEKTDFTDSAEMFRFNIILLFKTKYYKIIKIYIIYLQFYR